MSIKLTTLNLIFLISFFSTNFLNGVQPALVAAVQALNEGNSGNIRLTGAQGGALIDQAADAVGGTGQALIGRTGEEVKAVSVSVLAAATAKAYDLSYNSAYGALTGVGVALKDGALVAAPVLAVGAVVIGGGYWLYSSYYPSIATQQEQAVEAEAFKKKVTFIEAAQLIDSKLSFIECLNSNAYGPINRRGYPRACAHAARAYEFLAGAKQTQDKIDTFKRYSAEGLE